MCLENTFQTSMNVYPGNMPKADPHFGWMSIILSFTAIFALLY